MSKYFNICNLYIILWCLYYLQGIAYASGGSISQMLLLAIMLISGYYFVKVNFQYKLPTFLKVLNIFILLMSAYGVALMLDTRPLFFDFEFTQSVRKLEFLKTLYISLLPVYAMYYFTKQQLLTIESIQGLSLILIVSTTLSYFQAQEEALEKALELGSKQEEFTNNMGYRFLQIFPLMFFWQRKPVLQYILMGYIFTFIIMGLKRGAILIGAVCIMWFLYRMLVSSTKKTRITIVLLTILMLIAGFYFVTDFYATSEYFQYRVDQTIEGSSSGRDNLYTMLWEYFINQESFLNILFGNGAMMTIMIAGNFAHNDWLELAICQGVLGAIIYFAYFFSLFLMFRQSSSSNLIYNILGMVLLIMFTSSLFSMSYNSLSLAITLCLGYCMAKYTEVV